MIEMLRAIWTEDEGQDLIEYGLLLAIITVAAVVAITQIGPKVADYFTDANTALPEAD
ncbi:MAG TPA: Flp family type IVb pilin [Clostridia bacterium]|nr:Flp family type IVb pilin [Clostridia bacterium]